MVHLTCTRRKSPWWSHSSLSLLRAGFGDVVGSGFSPGLVAAESALGGTLHETEFGPLSAEFGMLNVFAVGHALIRLWVVVTSSSP